MSEYKIIVTVHNDTATSTVAHFYATESDARFQYAEWQGQGVDCKLILPMAPVFIAWEADVTERYRATVNVTDLPESVQIALADGATILDIAKGLYPGKPGATPFADERSDLEEYLADWEDGPYDEAVSDRSLDVSAMEREAKK